MTIGFLENMLMMQLNNPDVVTIPDEIRENYYDDTYAWFGGRRFKARLSPDLEFHILFLIIKHYFSLTDILVNGQNPNLFMQN